MTGVCDVCGGELYQRDDDRESTVRLRLEVYRRETAPVIDHYRARGQVTTISALGDVQDVRDRVLVAIGQGDVSRAPMSPLPSAGRMRGSRP
nr:hypothetical protein [Streptomyces sp. LBUM 1487]